MMKKCQSGKQMSKRQINVKMTINFKMAQKYLKGQKMSKSF